VSLFLVRFLRQDGVFLLRLMTMASNALTTVDLTGALWKNYWKLHPPISEVTLTSGVAVADQSTMLLTGPRRQSTDVQQQADDSTAVNRKRQRLHSLQYNPKQLQYAYA